MEQDKIVKQTIPREPIETVRTDPDLSERILALPTPSLQRGSLGIGPRIALTPKNFPLY
jgi:hypothetical protein